MDDMKTSNKIFEVNEDPASDILWNGTSLKLLREAEVKLGKKEYDFNSNIHNAISNKHPNLADLTDDEILFFHDILETIKYHGYRHVGGERKPKRMKYIKEKHPQRFANLKARIEDGPNHLQNERMESITPSKFFDVSTG